MTGNLAARETRSAAVATSTRLRRAVEREREQMQRERERLERRLGALRPQVRMLEDTLRALDARDQLLAQLVHDAPVQGSLATIAGGATVLRGAHIRRVAVGVLIDRYGTTRSIHYRAWFDLLAENGYVVLGQRPLATFLTNVTRSPVVARGDAPGFYRLDNRACADLQRELGEHQAELRDLADVLARDAGVSDRRLIEHRTHLMATVRRLERQLAEADEAFAPRSGATDTSDAQRSAAA